MLSRQTSLCAVPTIWTLGTGYPPSDHKAAGRYIMVWTAERTASRKKGKVGRPAILSEERKAPTNSNHTAARLGKLRAFRSTAREVLSLHSSWTVIQGS